MGDVINKDNHCVLNITNLCNQKCIYCYEGEHNNNTDLSFQEVKKLVDEQIGHMPGIVFMGGEAFLRKDITKIIKYIDKNGLWVSAFTNGQALSSKKKFNEIAATPIKGIYISMNFHDQTSFMKATGTSSKHWKQFLNTLDNIAEYLKHSQNAPINFEFSILVYRDTVLHLEEIVALLAKYVPISKVSIFFKMIQKFHSMEFNRELVGLYPSLKDIREHLDEAVSLYQNKTLVKVQGFPLCAIPGNSERSLDYKRCFIEHEVNANFENQSKVTEMPTINKGHNHPIAGLFAPICKVCSKNNVCVGLGTISNWHLDDLSIEHFPIPMSGEREVIDLNIELSGFLELSDKIEKRIAVKMENVEYKDNYFKINNTFIYIFVTQIILVRDKEFSILEVSYLDPYQWTISVIQSSENADMEFLDIINELYMIYTSFFDLQKEIQCFTNWRCGNNEISIDKLKSNMWFRNWGTLKSVFSRITLNQLFFEEIMYQIQLVKEKKGRYTFRLFNELVSVTICVEKLDPREKYFIANSDLGLFHPKEFPLDTATKQNLVKEYFKELQKELAILTM